MLPKQLQYHTSMILPALTTEEKLAIIGFNKSPTLMFQIAKKTCISQEEEQKALRDFSLLYQAKA